MIHFSVIMNKDQAYEHVVNHVLKYGSTKPTRQGGTVLSCTAVQYRATMGILQRGSVATITNFPLLTCKRVFARGVWEELSWFLRGSTNANELSERGVTIWDDDAAKAKDRGFNYKPGELGPVYGFQWRRCGKTKVDQIANLVKGIQKDPYGRRHIVNAWNVEEIPNMVLPPCHYAAQWVCQPDGDSGKKLLDCVVNMRSTDVGLGLPFNIASYAMLSALICMELGDDYALGEIVVNMADCHIYSEHVKSITSMLENNKTATQNDEPVVLTIPAALQGIDNFAHAEKGVLNVIVSSYKPQKSVKMDLKT